MSTAIPHRGPSDDTSTQAWDDPQVSLHKERQHAVRWVARRRVHPERSFARVYVVIHAQTDTLVFRQENLLARLC